MAKIRLNDFQRKLFDFLIFSARFIVASLPMYVIMLSGENLFSLQDIQARQVSSILNFSSGNSSVLYCNVECSENPQGIPTIIHREQGVGVSGACTGYRSFFALVGLIFAVPRVKLRKRVLGFLWAAPLIYIANVVRLFTTVLFSEIIGFEIVHNILWKGGMMVAVLAIWYAWLKTP